MTDNRPITQARTRERVLNSIYMIFEQHAELVAYLKHKVGKRTVQSGARLIGDTATISGAVPRRMIIISIGSGDALGPAREAKTWAFDLFLIGEDMLDEVRMLDLLEDLVVGYRTPDYDQDYLINRLQLDAHERLEAQLLMGRVVGVRQPLELTFVS